MQITCFEDLVREAGRKKTAVAVVNAHDESTLAAVVRARKQGVAGAVLTGDGAKIRALLTEMGVADGEFEIIDTVTDDEALAAAVDAIKSGRAGALMKGAVETSPFLRAVLDKNNDLRGGGLLSTIGIYETPNYHKLFAVSDFAMNIAPDVGAKRAIIENSVELLHRLGIENPKVAVLSETERLNPKIQASVDAAELKSLWQAGEISGCAIEGPIALDLAVNAKAAKVKGYESPVAGDADLLIVPDIVAGNMLVKALTELGGAQTAGVVLGAKIPVIMTSRSAREGDKYYSIALAAAGGYAL